jgi:type IV secretory pathway TraG/TraD family ATPase VirD4
LLDYPGAAFVLDLKGENYAVTARARRAMGQDVILVDPFAIAGPEGHGLNWLDTLDPDDADVVSRAAGLADMLVVTEGDLFRGEYSKRLGLDFLSGIAVAVRLLAELTNALLNIDFGQLGARETIQGVSQVVHWNPDVRRPFGECFAVYAPLGP